MSARRKHERTPHVVATLYEVETVSSDERYVAAATIEPHLFQLGKGAPLITVHLRHCEGGNAQFGEILKLTLTQAQELATALNFLVNTAERT